MRRLGIWAKTTDVDEGQLRRGGGQGSRLRYIDALRGIAALLVLWLHVANSYHTLSPVTDAHDWWLNDFVSKIDIGRIGVVVFFLISGFVIPFSIHRDSGAPVAGFAVRRLFRIYPAYWLSVPLAALAIFWLPGRPFGASDFLINLTLTQDVFSVPSAEGVYWTLLVELAFYALCVALLLTRSLFDPRRIAILAGALTIVHTFAMFMQWLKLPIMSVTASFWLLNLAVMLWGTLYRLQATAGTREPVADVLLKAIAAFYVIVLPVAVWLAIHAIPNYAIPYAIGFAVFIAGTRRFRIETRLTDWLGRISYSVYLFHPIVFASIHYVLAREPVGSGWRSQNLAVYLVVNAIATLAVASLVFRFVERPAIVLGHRIAAHLEGKAARRLEPVRTEPGAAAESAA